MLFLPFLDAPLHEFFPYNSGLKQEENPMLGHRSVRMVITNPEIPEMQIKAVLDAAELISFLRDDADRFLPRHLISMSPGKVYRSIIKAAQCQVTNPRKSVK